MRVLTLLAVLFSTSAFADTFVTYGFLGATYHGLSVDEELADEMPNKLTDDGKLNQRLTDPRWKAPKTYLVHVEGIATEDALAKLRAGVDLKDGRTLPAEAVAIEQMGGRVEWLDVVEGQSTTTSIARLRAAPTAV